MYIQPEPLLSAVLRHFLSVLEGERGLEILGWLERVQEMERETKPNILQRSVWLSSRFSHYEVITREQLASCSPSAGLSLYLGSLNQCWSSTHAPGRHFLVLAGGSQPRLKWVTENTAVPSRWAQPETIIWIFRIWFWNLLTLGCTARHPNTKVQRFRK